MTTRKVDHAALKVNQAFIITLLVLAFVLDSVWLAAFVGVVMLVGTAVPALALFKRIYRHILKPAGLVKPQVITDHVEKTFESEPWLRCAMPPEGAAGGFVRHDPTAGVLVVGDLV